MHDPSFLARFPYMLWRLIVGGAWQLVHFVLEVLGRLARHWFVFTLYAIACLAIWGALGMAYGLPYLFRENVELDGLALGNLPVSTAFLTQLLATLLAGSIWVFAVYLDRNDAPKVKRYDYATELGYFAIRIVPTALIPLLALAVPFSSSLPPLGQGELVRACLGLVFGLVGIGYMIVLSRVLDHVFRRLFERHIVQLLEWIEGVFDRDGRALGQHWRGPRRLAFTSFDASSPRTGPRRMVLTSQNPWLKLNVRALVHWLMFTATLAAVTYSGISMPGVTLFGLIGVLLAGYVFLNFFGENLRIWVLVVVFVLPVLLAGSQKYKYTFPGLTRYYAACDAADMLERADPTLASVPSDNSRVAEPCRFDRVSELAGASRQVQRHEALEGLKLLPLPRRTGGGAVKPKLVVVTSTGGAYRATYWTALVLDRLREESAPGRSLEGLAQSIRLLTGASGGMVGAAYFATLPYETLDKPATGTPEDETLERIISADIQNAQGLPQPPEAKFRRDSLSAIAQQLAQGDIFHLLLPRRWEQDRGRALESQWTQLQVTFESLRALEERGRRPSLIIAPMLAETGQPLLISNLDLTGISEVGAHQTFNLFQAFPDAPKTFTLATAVRMSSTFPFVSPAVDLPTSPPRRVLDAGYFDNYGMSIAIAYLRQRDVKDWIQANTSGVILVQINAYPVQTLGADSAEARCQAAGARPGTWLTRAFAWLFSPLEGVMAAREGSMVFRNDQEFETLKASYLSGRSDPDFIFDRVAFENAAQGSFSWFLPEQDLGCMRLQLAAGHNRKAMHRLIELWHQPDGLDEARLTAPVTLLAR